MLAGIRASTFTLLMLTAVVGTAAVNGAALTEATEILTGFAQSSADDTLAFATALTADLQTRAALLNNVVANITSNLAGQGNAAVAMAANLVAQLIATVCCMIFPDFPTLPVTAFMTVIVGTLFDLKFSLETIAIQALDGLVAVLTSMVGTMELALNVSAAVASLVQGAAGLAEALATGGTSAAANAHEAALGIAAATAGTATGLLANAADAGAGELAIALEAAFSAIADGSAAFAGGMAPAIEGGDGALRALFGPGSPGLAPLADAVVIAQLAVAAVLALLIASLVRAEVAIVDFLNWMIEA